MVALGGLPHEEDFEFVGAMSDGSKCLSDQQYPVSSKANRKLPQSYTGIEAGKSDGSYVVPESATPYATSKDAPAFHSSLPPLPPGVLSTEQWGRTKICFGKFKSRDWSYMDLLTLPDGEAQSYVKWCRARHSSAGGELKDLASFLFR